MNPIVVEVGPEDIRGPEPAAPELISTALDCIDDDLALLDERAVPVQDIWVDVLRAVSAGADAIVLICPSWWSDTRIDRILAAVTVLTTEVDIIRRAECFDELSGPVVEVSPDLVVVTSDARTVVHPVADDVTDVARRVAAAVAGRGPVTIDRPAGPRTRIAADCIAEHLRASGVAVRSVDEGVVQRYAAGRFAPTAVVPQRAGRRPRAAVLAGVGVTVAVCAGFGLRGPVDEPPDRAARLLVEGRIGVLVPADWPVRRITSGPGSARLQAISPSGGDVALHLTQSVGPDLAQTAEALSAALAYEPDGVFVDFTPADTRAGRPAVTYREMRAGRQVAWTVLVESGVRIAIGCQSAPGREADVRDACEQAIRSARAHS
ncbi:type VII secretion-associated protein, Rv3446c family, C-terminal domain-containing protein [Mycolicibacterium rutilum]|uniref:Type VII secretion-associated protein, Rv3446c family, C-terminal domain-containing protein n=1 Tax=Mycolicibacterium rutilum TaxID=370526 RepID=A0A1H6LV69_MYCRU|nr:type VII secretion-associated protein [Mycolicibacterium rutilum]SEH92673.1 type VII secretion-associated protein, Rv3446c family, C-terminal domain-containing protein [Mycolicibacterium rutilum]